MKADLGSVNIHSHSIGAIIFSIILPFHFYTTLYQAVPEAQPIDGVVFLIYFAGVAACFACSALYADSLGFTLTQADMGQLPHRRQSQSTYTWHLQQNRLLWHRPAHVGRKSRIHTFRLRL